MTADITRTPLWKKLTDHQQAVAALHLRELFDTDPGRGTDLTVTAGDLYVDYSKHRVTRETLGLLSARSASDWSSVILRVYFESSS